jgi:hypothetical protein
MASLIWTQGYSAVDLERFQDRYRLDFPPDLIALLRDRRLVEGPDWNDENAIRSILAWPFEGLLFDVEHNALWWPEWGSRPDQPDAREDVLRDVVARAPRLIPILAHRFLPATPKEAGNPVFSVHQSDIIHYGANLEDYLEREEGGLNRPWPSTIREIDFWSEMERRNNEWHGPGPLD